jgi:hypothetical protein
MGTCGKKDDGHTVMGRVPRRRLQTTRVQFLQLFSLLHAKARGAGGHVLNGEPSLVWSGETQSNVRMHAHTHAQAMRARQSAAPVA